MVNHGEGLPESGNNLPDDIRFAVDKIMVYFQLLFAPPTPHAGMYKDSRARRGQKKSG
jgi:hypothetical protein